jgi:hypothetical protein
MLSAEKVKFAKNKFRATSDGRVYRKGEVRYSNGEVYNGEWVDGRRHGKGVHTYRNGDKFVGEFEDGRRHGFGVLTLADHVNIDTLFVGHRYEGSWKNGKMHGNGLLIVGDGSSYDGELNRIHSHHRFHSGWGCIRDSYIWLSLSLSPSRYRCPELLYLELKLQCSQPTGR